MYTVGLDVHSSRSNLCILDGHGKTVRERVVRGLLVEAAWRGSRCSPSLRAFFERITGNDKDRRKIALIATAHHLARVMLTMLKTGTPWEERLAATATAAATVRSEDQKDGSHSLGTPPPRARQAMCSMPSAAAQASSNPAKSRIDTINRLS